MKRKVSKIGPATLMVSLPSKWCKENNIKRGDELEIDSQKGCLTISTEKRAEAAKEITIDLSKLHYYPRHLVAAAYKAGYDQVRVKYSTENERKDIEGVLSYTCLGYSILEETKSELLIKDIAKIEESEFEAVLKKSFFLVNEIARRATDFLESGEGNKLNELISQRRNLHKHNDFCRRMINKKKTSEYHPYLLVIIQFFHLVTCSYRDLCLTLSSKEHLFTEYPDKLFFSVKDKGKIIELKYLKFLEKINKQVFELNSLFYKPDMEKIDQFHYQNLSLIKELEKLIGLNKKKEEALVLTHFFLILNSLREMRDPLLAGAI